MTFAKAALRQIDIEADPVRAALLLETRGHFRDTSGCPTRRRTWTTR